jgi:tetratricopeptide (TPR) repeat protein
MFIQPLFRIALFICLMITACRHVPEKAAPLSQKAASDSFTNFMRTRVNPLFFDHKNKESRAILDSLKPLVEKQNAFSITCTWQRFMGMQYQMEDKLDSALIIYRQTLALAMAKDTSQKQIIAVKTQLADLFSEKKQFDSALTYARESYYLAKKIDTNGLPMVLMKLADIYFNVEDTASLRKYLFEGFRVSANSPKHRLAFANNITKYYDQVGQLDSALQFYEKFSESDSSLFNPYLTAIKYENLGILLTRKGKLEEGLQYQLKAMQLNRELDQIDAATLYNTAITYSKLRRFDTAARYLDQALAMAKEEEDQETITDVWHRRSTNLRSQGRYREALAALDSSFASFEVQVDSSNIIKARELETKYAVKAKDDEIRALAISNEANQIISRQQKLTIMALAGAFVLLSALGLVLWRRRKLAEQLRQTSLEQRLLRSQMEPHFIFNTLSVLQSFIRNNDSEKAVRFLNQFARLLRVTLENSRESFVPLKEEVAALENYLSLQAMRFEGSFDYRMNVYDMYEEEELMIPPMLLQPFVENAILHGLQKLDHKGHIEVTISRQQHVLHCTIDDNGSGMETVHHSPQKRSLSTRITQERLAILSRQTRQPASIDIVDKRQEQGQGTRVVLHIPFRKSTPFNG